jgi:hypothetical protein
MNKTEQVHFRVTPAEAHRLDELTQLTGHTRSTLLRHQLRRAEAVLLQVRLACVRDAESYREPAPRAGGKDCEFDS